MLLFDRPFEARRSASPRRLGGFARAAVWLVIALTALNVLSTVLECGFQACPDDPKEYELLKQWR